MIALAKLSNIDTKLYMSTGTKVKRRLINLTVVGNDVCTRFNKTNCTDQKFLHALLAFHSFTGCDTTSAFAGRGKVNPLLLLGKLNEYINVFSSPGTSLSINE